MYKTMPNIAGDQATAEPHEVQERMQKLTEGKTIHNLKDVLDFHHQFELIHPFQDGNGRVGRMIMFRQCLVYNIIPFIIPSENREAYTNGLKIFSKQPTTLEDEITFHQKYYYNLAKPFLKQYMKEKK